MLTIVALVSTLNIVCRAESQTLSTRHTREVTLNGQVPLVGHLPATQSMRLVLVLPLRDQAGLNSFLKEVYDPSNASYRKFLTVEEFTARFGPTQQDYDTLIQFAKNNGFTVVGKSRNRLNLDVVGSVSSIEKAFHVTMGLYQHPMEARTFFSPDREPTVDLAIRLWHIGGLDNYSTPKPMYVHRDISTPAKSNASIGSGPDASFLGSDMRAAYYTAQGGTLTGTGQSLALFELRGTDLTDLNTYYKNVNQTNNVPITLTSVDTQNTLCKEPTCDDTEQTLDMTQALGMAPGMSSLVMYIGTGGLSGQTVDDSGIFNAMATASPLNAQLSCSWGWLPADPSTDDPYFIEFAAQGQNLFSASGDSGNWEDATFVWPADSVYLTSVGGTDLDSSSAGGPWKSETAWVDSGGGVSPNKFTIPSWQIATAAGCSNCSQKYRNGPDVSANANNSFYVCADQTACTANLYGGTSFATPMWAGYMALTNEQYLANTGGTTTLGFINPLVYSIGLGTDYDTDFHDITSGCQSSGFCATRGYDLVTGWGSPNGPALLNALAGAPVAGYSLSASPTSVSVAQGSSGTLTISVAVTGGFDSTVTFTAAGQPTGVTVGFSPTSVTGAGTSLMTMTVAATTVAGTYPITVTGTSGSTTETTTVTLTVTGPAPNFKIGAVTKTITVAPGGSGTTKIETAISGGFDSAIALSSSAGSAVTFNPTSIPAPGSGTSTMTVTVGSTVKAGTYTITVTGTGGGLTHTTKLTLDVPD